MPTKTPTPTVAELHEQLPSNLKDATATLYACLAEVNATEPLRDPMEKAIAADARCREARAALIAFDFDVANDHERKQGSPRHDWSKPNPSRFTPDQRAKGESLWHAEQSAAAALKWAGDRYREAVKALASDPQHREAIMQRVERLAAEIDTAFVDAADRLDDVQRIIRHANIAAGFSLSVMTKTLRMEWQTLRARQARALAIERELVAPAAPEPEPDPKPRQRIVERDGVVFIGRR